MKKRLILLLVITLIIVTCKAQAQTTGFKIFGETVDYETLTIGLTSVNTLLTTLNLTGITPKWQEKYLQGVAIGTGAVQLGLGIYDARKNFTTLNLVNITAGTATIITNGYLLYQSLTKGGSKTPPKNKGGKQPTSWNIYSSPLPLLYNKQEIGIRLVKSF